MAVAQDSSDDTTLPPETHETVAPCDFPLGGPVGEGS